MNKIPLSQGAVALIDEADFEMVSAYKWYMQSAGNGAYASTSWKDQDTGGRTSALMHRMIMDAPKGTVVDHINGDGLDNRRENLRFVSRSQNTQNRHNVAPSSHLSVGMRGVFPGSRDSYTASISQKGEVYVLGTFSSADKAARAYDAKALELYGENAYTNFLPDGTRRKRPHRAPIKKTHIIQKTVGLRASWWGAFDHFIETKGYGRTYTSLLREAAYLLLKQEGLLEKVDELEQEATK